MRRLVQDVTDGLQTAAIGVLMFFLHYSLVPVFKLHLQRRFTFPYYRPVYTHAGRRNRARC